MEGPVRPPAIVPTFPSSQSNPATNTEILRQEARQVVSGVAAQPVLVEVIGTPGDGTAMTVHDVDKYEFRYSTGQGTAWVVSQNTRFGIPRRSSQTLANVMLRELPEPFDVAAAIEILRTAGYTASFRRVLFRKLADSSSSEAATYAFELSDKYVIVGATTGAVAEAASQPEPQVLSPLD